MGYLGLVFHSDLLSSAGLTGGLASADDGSVTKDIGSAVVRGEIDNRIEGRTTGRIWLAGRAEPLKLWLDGDCWRDLAGALLRFRNPQPAESAVALGLSPEQRGLIGDMTASRRVRAALDGNRAADPCADSGADEAQDGEDGDGRFEWRNTLYLEWFDPHDGRVLVEAADFELEIGEHAWTMDRDGEEAQKLANLQAMRDYVAILIGSPPESASATITGELDEFQWEERLKESDRLSDAYQEVLEKYCDEPDSERKEAFVMGWDGVLELLAQEEEEFPGNMDSDGMQDGDEFEPIPLHDFDSSADDDFWDDCLPAGPEDPGEAIEEDNHPLQTRAHELASLAYDLVGRAADAGSPARIVLTNLRQVSGKLAAALNGRGSGYEPETGYVLAQLKRCMGWINETLGACQELIAGAEDDDERAALDHLQSSCFGIRDEITELRRELKS